MHDDPEVVPLEKAVVALKPRHLAAGQLAELHCILALNIVTAAFGERTHS
jgi:hypothetical protein